MKLIIYNLGILCFCLYLSSCNLYDGPTRKIVPVVRELPPPVEKVVGQPYSKSEYIGKAYSDIKESLDDAEVILIEDSIKVLFPNNIVFDSKSELPSSDYMPPLNEFIVLLKKYKKTNILISGHTDNRGKEEMNKQLSKSRAQKIGDYLQIGGIKSSRLESWGLGSIVPIADNGTPEGRSKNRRVEFIVLYDDK
jgi:outer membrane protein OmpA-like peptidoglycan-associated protein